MSIKFRIHKKNKAKFLKNQNRKNMTTIDPQEIEKFAKMAQEWWSPTGKFKPLHKFNPIRLQFLKQKICAHFGLDFSAIAPFKNNDKTIKIIDIGCGGGLITEPFARMQADITGIDAGEKNIKIAQIHADESGLNINYEVGSAEEYVQKNQQFDVVFALEIIEHVSDVEKFVQSCSQLLKPNGLMFVATLNRTAKSLIMAKYGVEYILRWLPIGTHDWHKFLKPSEIEVFARKYDLQLQEIQGFNYNIFKDQWSLGEDLSINYMMVFTKKNS